MTVFAKELSSIKTVFDVVNIYDENDIYSRVYNPKNKKIQTSFSFAVPQKNQLEFFEDIEADLRDWATRLYEPMFKAAKVIHLSANSADHAEEADA